MGVLIDYIHSAYPWLTVRFALTTVLYSLLIAVVIRWLWWKRRMFLLAFKLPGPFSVPWLSSISSMKVLVPRADQLNSYKYATLKFSSPYHVWIGSTLAVIVTDPSDVECIINDNFVPMKPKIYFYLSKGFGNGLFTARGGEMWKKHRMLLNPAFNELNISNHHMLIEKQSKKLINCLQQSCSSDVVDLTIFIRRFCADVINESLFQDKESSFQDANMDNILNVAGEILTCASERISNYFLHCSFLWSKTEAYLLMRGLQHTLAMFFSQKIKTFTTAGNDTIPTPINILKYAQHNRGYAEDDVVAELMNIFIAGLESTSNTLSLFISMIAMNRKHQDIIFEEINQNIDFDTNIVGQVKQCKYLDQCLKETMRLFPTTAVLLKEAHEDVTLPNKNITIPEGTIIVIPTYTIHRNESFWENPNEFNPERFKESTEAGYYENFSFIPYSKGQRNCIGHYLGEDMLKIAIVYLMKHFEFKSNLTTTDIQLVNEVYLKPKNGCKVFVSKRRE